MRTDEVAAGPTGDRPVPSGPVLVACGHGTSDPAGRRALAELRIEVARCRPGLEVVAASVDVQKPALPDVVQRLAESGRRSVVVPLLLSAGYHVKVDVAEAVAASGGTAVAAAPLGPDPVLVDVLAERLDEAGADRRAVVVLAAAGSSDARAVADVAEAAAGLAGRRGTPVLPAYLSAAEPTVVEAVASLRSREPGRPVAVSAYLLAPGVFSRRLDAVGADVVAAPLGAHPSIAALVVRRYDEALDRVPGSPSSRGGRSARAGRGA